MKVEVMKTCVVTNQRITTDVARLPQTSTLIMMHKSPQQATRHKSDLKNSGISLLNGH